MNFVRVQLTFEQHGPSPDVNHNLTPRAELINMLIPYHGQPNASSPAIMANAGMMIADAIRQALVDCSTVGDSGDKVG